MNKKQAWDTYLESRRVPIAYHGGTCNRHDFEAGYDAARAELEAQVTASCIKEGWQMVPTCKFKMGDKVRKTKGSRWQGTVVGFYSTALTPEGYAVESDTETGSVQIYPATALEYKS